MSNGKEVRLPDIRDIIASWVAPQLALVIMREHFPGIYREYLGALQKILDYRLRVFEYWETLETAENLGKFLEQAEREVGEA